MGDIRGFFGDSFTASHAQCFASVEWDMDCMYDRGNRMMDSKAETAEKCMT